MAGVWVLLVERGLTEGADVGLFWHRDAAAEAARTYMGWRWAVGREVPGDVDELIEIYNGLPSIDEHIFLAMVEVQGHQDFTGDVDDRPRCLVCGEPVELADVDDPDSWVHAADANDWADHTAEVDPMPQAEI